MRDSPPLRVTLLGTGTSTGIPVPGCGCEVCSSNDPRDRRLRCACYIQGDGLNLLVDTGPDLRTQCLQHDIRRVDAVLYTHEHFDHVAGLDDLRPFMIWNRTPLPCYATPRTCNELRRRYDYIFVDGSYPGVPKLELNEIRDQLEIGSRYDEDASLIVLPVPAFHGDLPILGFRIGRFAYMTDVSRLPEASYDLLKGLSVLVLSALRPTPHPTHFSVPEAIDAARRIGAEKTYFIHMTHNILHGRDDSALPDGVQLGYDGLVLEVGA
jgi:phosphoribosyl 1,2-cyclic phosphate phosphodiesterase